MTDEKIIDRIMNSIKIDGVCPETVLNEGHVVQDVSDINVDKRTSTYAKGTVTLDLEDNDMEFNSIVGEFEIDDNKVEFGEFEPV